MKTIINWKEHCKLRIISGDDSRIKHEAVKLLIMMISKKKYKQAGIYSEVPLQNGDIADVMTHFGNEKVFYEIQRNISPDWLESIKQRDIKLDINTIVINLNDLSDNLPELTKQLKELVI